MTDDHLLFAGARGPLAWRPGVGFVLASTTRQSVRLVDASSGRTLQTWRRPSGTVTAIEWSSDGWRLQVLSPHHLRVYDSRGGLVDQDDPAESRPDVDAAFRPRRTELAVARVHGSQSSVYILSGRPLGNVTGVVREVEWTRDGRGLIVTWQSADQWILARAGGRHFPRGRQRVGAVPLPLLPSPAGMVLRALTVSSPTADAPRSSRSARPDAPLRSRRPPRDSRTR